MPIIGGSIRAISDTAPPSDGGWDQSGIAQ
jgi:hypothetical protein